MKNVVFTLALVSILFAASSASGDLVANGDFSSNTIAGNANHATFANLDNGWVVKGTPPGWDFSNGNAEYISSDANRSGLAQANSITTETGNDCELSFDWTPVAGALDLNYTVVAWVAGTSPAAGDRFFTGLNFISQQSRVIGTGGTWTDLNDGTVRSGNANAALNTYTGTAGVATTETLSLNFGGGNIEDFDYIGVKFWSGDGTVAGGIIDNVIIGGHAVPEPSSLGFLALLGLGLVTRRRS